MRTVRAHRWHRCFREPAASNGGKVKTRLAWLGPRTTPHGIRDIPLCRRHDGRLPARRTAGSTTARQLASRSIDSWAGTSDSPAIARNGRRGNRMTRRRARTFRLSAMQARHGRSASQQRALRASAARRSASTASETRSSIFAPPRRHAHIQPERCGAFSCMPGRRSAKAFITSFSGPYRTLALLGHPR